MAHGAPDFKRYVLIEGNDGTGNKQVYVNPDGKIITLIQGEHVGAPKTLELDANGNITAKVQGEYAGSSITLALNENGQIVLYGEHEGVPKALELDVNGGITAKIQGEFEGVPKTVVLNDDGQLIMQGYGEYNLDSQVRLVQQIESVDDVLWYDKAIITTYSFNTIYGNSCLKMAVIPGDYAQVRFNDITTEVYAFRYFAITARCTFSSLHIIVTMNFSDGAQQVYYFDVNSRWHQYVMDFNNPNSYTGTPDIHNLQYFRTDFVGVTDGPDLYVDDFMGHEINSFTEGLKQVLLASDGSYVAELSALYEGYSRKLVCDGVNNLKVNIAGQKLSCLDVSCKCKGTQCTHFYNGATPDNTVIFQSNNNSGQIQGGIFTIDYPGSSGDWGSSGIVITIDDTEWQFLGIVDINWNNMNTKDTYPFYIYHLDDSDQKAEFRITPGTFWENNITLKYNQADATSDPCINGYFLYRNI